jgi:MraZ protein
MLMGEYSHSLDAKGRLIIPAKFREQMGDVFVISKGLDGCLFAFPPEEWQKLEAKLQKLPLTNKDARRFSRYFLAGAAEAELDRQGRVLIPQNLREAAGLERDVILCGVGNRVEIWDRDRWLEASDFDDVDELADHMSDLGD